MGIQYFNCGGTPASTTQNIGCPSIMTPLTMGKTNFLFFYSLNVKLKTCYTSELLTESKNLLQFIRFLKVNLHKLIKMLEIQQYLSVKYCVQEWCCKLEVTKTKTNTRNYYID